MQYLSVHDWLISLNLIGFANGRISFSCKLNNFPWCVCVCVCVCVIFIHSSMMEVYIVSVSWLLWRERLSPKPGKHCCCCSVHKSWLTLQPHGLQHAKLLCPPLPLGVCSDSCPLSWWCCLTSHPLLPASPLAFTLSQHQSFPMSQLFPSSGQSTGTSASASILPVNIHSWFPLRLTGLILQSKALSRVFPAQQFESINSLVLSLLYGPTLTSIHDYWKN